MWQFREGLNAATTTFLCLSAIALQQDGRPRGDDQEAVLARAGGFSASIEMVRVPVVVMDDEGEFIRDLSSASFEVEDGGKDHPVSHFVSDAAPASVGIVVDRSVGMAPFAPGVRAAIGAVVNTLRPDDELFLIHYGENAEMVSAPSSEKLELLETAARYSTAESGERALYDALGQALSLLERATNDKRSLILIGAESDTASAIGEIGLQQHIHRIGVSIHAIALSNRPVRRRPDPRRVNRVQTLPEIVRYTGGLLAQKPSNVDRYGGVDNWLATAGADIATYVKHQYLLHYVPQSPPRPGVWRTIRVGLDVDYEKVRARSGYMR